MNKITSLLLASSLLYALPSTAQKNILDWNEKSNCSLKYRFDTIEVLDQRLDTAALMGSIQRGMGNKRVGLKSNIPLAKGLEQWHSNNSAQTGASCRMMILLHDFYAWEEAGAVAEKGKFRYKADYFMARSVGPYYLLKHLDTVVTMSAMNVSNKLLNKVMVSLCELCNGMSYSDAGTPYGREELLQFDARNKALVPAYASTDYSNAAYEHWADFLQLKAAANTIVIPTAYSFRMEYRNSRGKRRYASPVFYEIFSCNGKLYYSNRLGFWEIYRKQHDFLINAEFDVLGHETPFNSIGVIPGVIAGGLVGGMLGSAVMSTTSTTGTTLRKPTRQVYIYKIDAATGVLIPLQ